MAGIHAALWVPRAERSCLPLPDTLSMSRHSSSFIPIVPFQNASLPPCDALPSFLSSPCELVFSWAELQPWMPRGRDTVPWQDLGLCLEAQRHLLRASRRAWALGRVLATPPALSCSIRSRSTSVPGLWQLYLAVMLPPISWIRNRRSRCPLPLDQPGHSSTAGHRSPRAPASPSAVLKGKAFGQDGLTFLPGSLGTCNAVATC